MKSILDESKCYSQNIPIEKLYPSKLNMFDTSDISDLIASIRSVGLLSPLTVCGPDANGMYEILAGERRYLSLRELGKEYDDELYKCPPCRVLNTDLDQDRKELIIILSNMEVREISDLNVYRFRVVKILKAICINSSKKHDYEAIRLFANQMGFSRRYAAMYFSIFGNKIRDIQDLVAEGLVPVSIAARACNLTESYQHEFANRIRAEMQKTKSERKSPAKILEELRILNEKAEGQQLALVCDSDDKPKMPMTVELNEQTAVVPTISECMGASSKPDMDAMDIASPANPLRDFAESHAASVRYDMDGVDATEINEQSSVPSVFTPEPMPQANSYSKGADLPVNKSAPKPSIADDMSLFGDSELVEMSSMDMDTGYMSNPYSGNYTYCAESESSIDNDTTGRLEIMKRYSNVNESEDNAVKTNTLIHKQLDRIRNRAINGSLIDEDYKMIEDVRAWIREVDELIGAE